MKPFNQRYVVDPETGCWLWIRRTKDNGYGWCGKRTSAHRRAWELYRGPIPPGLFVLHRCDTPLCVNPDHLFLGTNSDNINDAVQKGLTCGRPLSRQEDDEIFDLRFAPMTQAEIGDAYGIWQARVALIWRKRGFVRGHSNRVAASRARGEEHAGSKITDLERNQIWDLRNSGMTQHEIGLAYGVTEGAVSHLWRQRGYRQRTFRKRGPRNVPRLRSAAP